MTAMHADLSAIAAYVMREVPLAASDVGSLFGTRHGVEAFCIAPTPARTWSSAVRRWQRTRVLPE